ncbi:MAG: TMEM165/GDT1 family protein [Thermoanaerobacteraceae bacterium]|nr:TMEM165/GDT1 family protein [Thermoanaerobacteraceae bacterium]
MLKVLISTFLIVFFAELGDKTQLSTMFIASKTKYPKIVFIGSSIALIMSSALAVVLGLYMKRYIPEEFIRYGGAVIFILFGILMLIDGI